MTAYMFDYNDLKDMMQGYGICFIAMWCGFVFGHLLKVGGVT